MEWHLIADESKHPLHWHYGEPFDGEGNGNVAWGSITASNTDSITPYSESEWVVEYYAGKEPCRKEADSYSNMLHTVARFMEKHD